MSQRENLKELSGLDLEGCEREEMGESESGADIGEDASRDG